PGAGCHREGEKPKAAGEEGLGLEALHDLNIPVEVNGRAAAAIDMARLQSAPPEFTASGRRAWKLSSLVGGDLSGGGTIEVEDGDGVRTMYTVPPGGWPSAPGAGPGG